jgi:hypothetical protein
MFSVAQFVFSNVENKMFIHCKKGYELRKQELVSEESNYLFLNRSSLSCQMIFLQIILKLQNNCNYTLKRWFFLGGEVVSILVDRRFDLYIKAHIFVVWHFASYKFWNVFDDMRKGNIRLFSIMELYTKAWTNHYFTFKGKKGLCFSSEADLFAFTRFFLHCKYLLFVNLQICFY